MVIRHNLLQTKLIIFNYKVKFTTFYYFATKVIDIPFAHPTISPLTLFVEN